MVKAVIFDMEGTIVNTTQCDFLSWQKLFSDQGIKISFKDYKNFIGKKGAEIIKDYFKVNEDKINFLHKRRRLYFIKCAEKKGLKTARGLTTLLETLIKNKYRLALATASSKRRMNFILKMVNIKNYFKVAINGDDVTKGKPNPETFLKAAKRLHYLPKECVVIEDAPNGILAAKRAKMKCIAVTATHKRAELIKADKIVNSLSDITMSMINNL